MLSSHSRGQRPQSPALPLGGSWHSASLVPWRPTSKATHPLSCLQPKGENSQCVVGVSAGNSCPGERAPWGLRRQQLRGEWSEQRPGSKAQ